MTNWQGITGLNRAYVLELYDRYLKDPNAVDAETRALFATWTPPADIEASAPRPGGCPLRGNPAQGGGRGQPRPVHPALRAPGGPPRPARIDAAWRSLARAGDPRCDRRGPPGAAADAHFVAARRRRLQHAGRRQPVPGGLLLDLRSRLRTRVRARRAGMAAQCRRKGTVSRAGRSDRTARPARAPDAGRSLRALPAPCLPGQDPFLDRRAGHDGPDPRRDHRRRRRSRCELDVHRHGPPGPSEHHGARPEQALRAHPRRVQGPAEQGQLPGRHGVDRRREVPRRRASRDQERPRDAHGRVNAAQPEPPRSRGSRRGRHGARGRHERRPGRSRPVRSDPLDPGAHSRRRGIPRPGDRGRNAEPGTPRRIQHRRHHPHHRQQPARIHGDVARVVQHVVRERAGARFQGADRSCQCRRSRGLRRGGAACHRLPQHVQARLPDRPGRLPPPRAQRGRRTGVHPAADVPEDCRAADGARDLREDARLPRPRSPMRRPPR